jgi:hypothetical protein
LVGSSVNGRAARRTRVESLLADHVANADQVDVVRGTSMMRSPCVTFSFRYFLVSPLMIRSLTSMIVAAPWCG